MVLAEFVKFNMDYESCGIECFEGITLEPCLLQSCFLVARRKACWRVCVIIVILATMIATVIQIAILTIVMQLIYIYIYI